MSTALRLRGFNFFYFSLFALFLSFLPVYCSSIGMSGAQIGMLLGAGSVISIVSQPLWGMVSDKYRTIKTVLLLILAASVLVGTGMYRSHQVWTLSLMVGLMYLLYLPTDPLVESLNFQTSQRIRVSYGSLRMFGALGYAVTSLSAGLFVQSWGMGSLSWVFLTFGVLSLLLCLGLTDVEASSKPARLKHLGAFFLQSHTLTFFVLVLLVAIPHKMNDSFIGLYMAQLGGSVTYTGLCWFVMTITETVFFALSSKLIKPGKETLLMSIAAGLYALRFLLCAFVRTPSELVGLQVFQGCTFVFFYAASIQYLYSIVPEQWKSTGQTVLTVVFFGVSGIIGSGFGGWLIELLGGSALYKVMACLSAVSFAYSFILLKRTGQVANKVT
ncbi:MFS transporter [Paenibacillus cremeus]|nr:MFS transporter [Paenibacillus cremeus]